MGFPAVRVAGVDEVGRGCLAGPVVAAAVLLPNTWAESLPPWCSEVDDSKKLTAPTRERLSTWIHEHAIAVSIAECSASEIDTINIHQASLLAMARAVNRLEQAPEALLVDGKWVPRGIIPRAQAIIQGDHHSLSIACASIVAKVYRDRLMTTLDADFPGYGFAVHKGYSTPQHQRALKSLGASIQHRRSFAPVAAVVGAAGI